MPDSNAQTALPNVSQRYSSEAILGQGGMGIVYRAYDNITKRQVAVKTMWGDIQPGALELFEREWTILARLSHPNIVDILDTGEFQDENGLRKPYFVMPLLPGKTLDEIIKGQSQRLTVERVVEIMCQACRGLQAAHDQNLVHRDLKPSNIFVMDDYTAKIIDFGVAHLADSRSVTGMKGTLQYMAPEQTDLSSPVSSRSDIFSLAVVCYEALTGRKPFARRTEADTIDAIRTHIPPPASEINGAINNLMARTVHKAMAKQPWQRFSSCKEFADTLQRAMRNEPIERFDRAKIQPRIERVKKAYSEGDNQFAMEILTELESEGHIDPDMPVLRMQIEQSVRQRNIRQLLESARTRMESDEHPLALQKLNEVLALDPNNFDAITLRSQIERQRSEKQLEQWFRLVEEHRENHLYSQARQGLQEILKIDNANTRARSMLTEIDQTEQAINKVREEKQRLYEGAMASYKNGEISTALSKLERGLDISRRPDGRALTTELDAQYQSFYNQVRSERDNARNAYAEGRKSIEDKNAVRALEICEEFLQKHPSDPMFQALKLEAEEMQRQEQSAAIGELNRRADAETDLDKKFNIIKEACERFPNEPHFKSSLKLVRDRRDLVNSIIARAKQYEERGQFVEAGNQWDILRNIYPVYPGLEFEIQRLGRRREDHAQSETKARWMERIDGHFASGEYSKARDVIREAQSEFPNDKELEGLVSLADQGIRRSAEASVLLTHGRDLCASKNFPLGLDALRKAERLDPRNASISATLLSCLVEHSRDLINKDWRAAEPLIQEAEGFSADDPVVRSLKSLLESSRRSDAISNILVEARSLQGADDIPGALQKVEEGLREYPNEVRLSQLHNTLRSAAAASNRTEVMPSPKNASKDIIPPSLLQPAAVPPQPPKGEPLHEPQQPVPDSKKVLEAPPQNPLAFAATSFQSAAPQAGAAKDTIPSAKAANTADSKPQSKPNPIEPELIKAAPWVKAPWRSPSGKRSQEPVKQHPIKQEAVTALAQSARPSSMKPTWLLALITAAVLIVGSLIYSVIPKKRVSTGGEKISKISSGSLPVTAGGMKVNLIANQPGVRFKVDGAVVPASTNLKAGEHTGEASLPGFTTDVHSFSVPKSASAPVMVAFALNPALPELRFSSSLDGGSVILDDATAVDLQEGSYSKSDIAMGEHRVRILEGRRDVLAFTFAAAPGQLIKLTSPLTSRTGSEGIAVSSLAGAAQVYGTSSLKASLGDQALAAIPSGGLTVTAATPPQHISVSDGNKTRELTPDASPLPVLTIMLNGALDRIPVTVSANVPDSAVSLDGRTLKRHMVNGSRLVPLPVGSYNITVSHDGYQAVAPQHLVIRAGDQAKHLEFQLMPLMTHASFEISGAPADASIFVDDVRAGTINPAGGFSKDLSSGVHQMTVRKAGFEEFKQSHEFKVGENFRLLVQMRPAVASVSFRVTPANARMTLRHEDNVYTPLNGSALSLPPGAYVTSASAEDYKTRTETIQIESAKSFSLDWVLQPIPHVTEAVGNIPFANKNSWTLASGWLSHTGNGISVFTGGPGTHTFDFQRKKNKFGMQKRVIFYADYANQANYTQYSTNGKDIKKTVLINGQAGTPVSLILGQETGDVIRIIVELSSDTFTLKNRGGAAIDSIHKTGIGRFALADEVTLSIAN